VRFQDLNTRLDLRKRKRGAAPGEEDEEDHFQQPEKVGMCVWVFVGVYSWLLVRVDVSVCGRGEDEEDPKSWVQRRELTLCVRGFGICGKLCDSICVKGAK
jgi:hypothetical protein